MGLITSVTAKTSVAAFALVSLATLAIPASAQTFNEVGDAGQLLNSAQTVGGPFTTIQGNLFVGDIDLYKVTFNFTGPLTIMANQSTFGLDLNLHAFNSAGNPIGVNDNANPSTFNSLLTLNITPGTYFFGVGANNLEALDTQGTIIQDNDNGTLNPSGVLAGWRGPGTDSGGYVITFSTPTAPAAVAAPEPGSLALLALTGLPMVGAILRRRSARS